MSAIVPIPKCPVCVRGATVDDLAFIDRLQKQHHQQLGFFPRAQLEGYLKNGWMLVAEDGRTGAPIGYCAWRDRYQKRDELGAIFQLCVAGEAQRKLVGAMLVQSAFERSAYGCKLFCCWCAQDIAANRFWESLGFVPLAFRAGSRRRGRVHIFWQRRIRPDDTTTPYWFPSQTSGGSIQEDRIVLPIPPGVHWSDAKPIVLPGGSELSVVGGQLSEKKRPARRLPTTDNQQPTTRATISSGGLRFGAPEESRPKKRAGGTPTPRKKNDPKLIAAARELRDRWLERVNDDPSILLGNGKYEVSRMLSPVEASAVEGSKAIAATTVEVVAAMPALPHPIAA